MGKQYSLSVLFKVLDKATGPIRGIGKRLKDLTRPVTELDKRFQKLGRTVQKTGKRMKDVGKNLSLKLTAPIALIGGLATRSAIKFESAFTGVIKTVEATEEQFAVLKKGLMSMALKIPLATEEIFGIAEAAGQLGIKQEDILAFTKVMADLGATTNITARDAAMQLARFATVTGMAKKDVDRLGATIVDLGNNTETTEAEIVEMAMRLAGAGKTIGLLPPQIMGLAAALSSVGIQAEMGGSAFSRVMIKIDKELGTGSKKMKGFAYVAGKSVADFEKAWKEDASDTMIDFIEGLATMQEEGKNVNIILEKLGFQGIRVGDAIRRASGAGDKFRKTMKLGNEAWKENTALTKEANLRYGTAEAKLTMMRNRVAQLGASFGDILVVALLKVVDFLKPVINWLKKLSPTTKTIIIIIGLLVAAVGPLLIVFGMLAASVGAIMAVGGPVIAMIAAIAAMIIGLGLAGRALIVYWEPVKAFFSDLFGFITKKIQDTIGALVGLLPDWLKKKIGLGFAIERPDTLKIHKEIEEERSRIARSKAGENVYFGRETKGREQSLAKIAELEGRLRRGAETSGGIKRLIGAVGATGKSETDINIKLQAESGTTATIERVKKKKGDAVVNVASEAYMGVF